MTGLEAIQSVQFVNVKGKSLAILSAEKWNALMEWLETVEDIQIAKKAFTELEAAGGNPVKAGWIEWEKADKELE